MPLLLKSLLGRSPLGLQIALRQQDLQEELARKTHYYDVEKIQRAVELTHHEHKSSHAIISSKIEIQQLENELRKLKNSTWSSSLDLYTPKDHQSKNSSDEVKTKENNLIAKESNSLSTQNLDDELTKSQHVAANLYVIS
jgi:hypothetical protein